MAARWYIIHVYSGFEQKVKDAVLEQAEQKGLTNLFDDVLVPSEEVVEVRRGKKVSTDRKFFPGYVLIKMDLNDETWSLGPQHRQGDGLSRCGRSTLADSRRRGRAHPGADARGCGASADVGVVRQRRSYRVTDGPFSTFEGVVEDVDDHKGRLTVSVSIFGRSTPVELEYSQVERI